MRDRLIVYVALLTFCGWHWAQLERPNVSAAEMILLGVLASAPALFAAAGRTRLALTVVLPVSLILAIGAGGGVWPWELDHRFYPIHLGDVVSQGARGFLNTTTPIDAGRFQQTDNLVNLAFVGLAMLMAWLLLVMRRPLLASLAAFAIYAIPSTVLVIGSDGIRAAIFLALVLLTLTVCRESDETSQSRRTVAQILVLGSLAVVGAVIVGEAPGVSKAAFLNWQSWNPLADATPRVSVGYVWNQNYGPLHWPKKTTQVLQVTTTRPLYWKAAVLNDFNDDHWSSSPIVERFFPAGSSEIEPPASLIPGEARHPSKGDFVNVSFKITGLADPHLLSSGFGLRWQLPSSVNGAQLNDDDTVTTQQDPSRDTSYSVQVYAPNPTPKQLSAAGTRFPGTVSDTIRVNNFLIPAWGTQRRGAQLKLPVTPAYAAAANQVWQRSGAAGSTTEYAAVANVEAYLRSDIFKYDQTPRYRSGVPVLVDFLTRAHTGYCQMFAGSMALVLRLHGIPARVAVGFTTGSLQSAGQQGNVYYVNDRMAHDWVEVYFPGWGWLPFDPTPTRSLPPAVQYSTSSVTFNHDAQQNLKVLGTSGAAGAQAAAASNHGPNGPGSRSLGIAKQDQARHHEGGSSGLTVVGTAHKHGTGFLTWVLYATLLIVGALGLFKLAAVRWRYLRRGPRARASAAYHELATFAADQGVPIGSNLTFEQLAARLKASFDVDASRFASTASAARYAPLGVATASGHDLRPQLRLVKRGIRVQLSRRDRFFGALRLRAVLAQTTDVE
jgi:hypothetical protein